MMDRSNTEESQPSSGMASVCRQDASNYGQILRALGMEEEGDPVAEVIRLIQVSQQVAKAFKPKPIAEVLAHGPNGWLMVRPIGPQSPTLSLGDKLYTSAPSAEAQKLMEPTREMIAAGAKAAREYFEDTGGNSVSVIYRAMAAAAQPVEVQQTAQPVAFNETHIDYINRYGGRCRDCGDENGVCPSSGLPCVEGKKAIQFVLSALAYGLNHKYLPPLYAATQPVAVRQEPDATTDQRSRDSKAA